MEKGREVAVLRVVRRVVKMMAVGIWESWRLRAMVSAHWKPAREMKARVKSREAASEMRAKRVVSRRYCWDFLYFAGE